MKNYLKLLVAAVAVTLSINVFAAIPAGYYRSLEGKSSAELKTAVYNLVRNFTQVSSYQDLPQYFQKTDVYPNSRQWWDMYSNIPLYAPSFSGLNREHSFPKSWWGGLTGVSAYVDLNHLYPSEQEANMAKSNYPLGEVSKTETPKFSNGVSTVGYPVTGQGGGCQWVFEPADEYKGDFARTYFYMVTCYQDLTWTSKYMYMMGQNTYPTLTGWASSLLLKWHREDPVSEKEINRNDAVYSIQNNRNPFIDHPELAEYIWGTKVGEKFSLSGSSTDTPATGDPVLNTPTQGMSVDFGEVAVGGSVTSQLFFSGENLTGTLDLVISGTNRSMFSIPSNSLSTTLVNSSDGTWLRITYKPTEVGEHEARLIISEGGMLGGSRGIALIGHCYEVPTLSACTATNATNVTTDSYCANWTTPASDTVDYWVVTRTRYSGGVATQEEVLAEESGIVMNDFNESESESYSVQSVRLGYRSPMSNVIFVDHAGISGVKVDQGLAVQGFEGCLRFICSAPQTNACIYDVSGKLVMHFSEIHNNMDVDLQTGIYFVKTAECGHPIKVAVK